MLFHATFTPRHCAPTAQEATLGLAKWCENYFKLTRKMKEETFCSSFERYCSWVWGFIQNTQNRPWSFSMNFLLIQATEHLTRNLLLQQTRIPFFGSSRFFTFLKYNLWYFGFRKFDWPWMNLNFFLKCLWWRWTWVLPSKQKARKSTTAVCSFFVEIESKQKCLIPKCLSSAYRKRKANQQFDIGKSFCNNFFPQPDIGERKWWWRQHHSHCTSAQRSNSKFQFV